MNAETLSEIVASHPRIAGMLLSAAVLINASMGSTAASFGVCTGP